MIEKIEEWVNFALKYIHNKARNNRGLNEWDCGYVAALEEIKRLINGDEPINNIREKE